MPLFAGTGLGSEHPPHLRPAHVTCSPRPSSVDASHAGRFAGGLCACVGSMCEAMLDGDMAGWRGL